MAMSLKTVTGWRTADRGLITSLLQGLCGDARVTTPEHCSSLSLVPDRPRRCSLEAGASTATRQSIFTDYCVRGSQKPALACKIHPPSCSIASAPINRPTHDDQIAIARAAHSRTPPPAISSFGGFRTPASECVAPSSSAGIRKPSQQETHAPQQTISLFDQRGRAI